MFPLFKKKYKLAECKTVRDQVWLDFCLFLSTTLLGSWLSPRAGNFLLLKTLLVCCATLSSRGLWSEARPCECMCRRRWVGTGMTAQMKGQSQPALLSHGSRARMAPRPCCLHSSLPVALLCRCLGVHLEMEQLWMEPRKPNFVTAQLVLI